MPLPSNPAEPAYFGLQIHRARPLLGTLVEIRLWSAIHSIAALHAAADAAFAAVDRVHRLMSFHDTDSDIARVNRDALGMVVKVDAQTWTVLELGRSIAIASDGGFDLATGSILQSRGLLPGRPFDDNENQGDCRTDLELVADCEVRFKRPLRIDVGGIAKGYAVDRAIKVLREAGVESALVNAGGDIAVLGTHRVGIRDPLRPAELLGSVSLHDEALATSGSYFASTADRIALVERRDSGIELPKLTSVSVRAPVCRLADALTKVALFSPSVTARGVLDCYGAKVCEVDAGGAGRVPVTC